MGRLDNDFNNVNYLYRHLCGAIASASDTLLDVKGSDFWKRYHGYGLYRICYILNDHYSNSEPISKSDTVSFIIFEFYDDVRDFYQFSNGGRQQLDAVKLGSLAVFEDIQNLKLNRKDRKVLSPRQKFFHKIKIVYNSIILGMNKIWPIKAIVIRTYFSIRTQFKIFLTARAKTVPFFLTFPVSPPVLDKRLRVEMIEMIRTDLDEHFDKKFVEYIIKALLIMLPTSTIEDYATIKEYCSNSSISVLKPDFIINESITSDHQISIISSLANVTFGTKFIYNEHNKLTKVFKYNTIFILDALVDKYLTHGWSPGKNEIKTVKSSSLYPGFRGKLGNNVAKNWALYVTGVGFCYGSEFSNSSLSHSAQYLNSYLYERKNIFLALSDGLAEHIDYKPYNTSQWELTVDIDHIAHDNNCNLLDPKIRLTSIYKDYELVIVDYLSTAYIEVMVLDKPVVVLWSGPVNDPTDEGKSLVDGLKECGVFHSTGDSMGKFINQIKGREGEWWQSPEVKNAVSSFIEYYLNFDDDLIEQLSNL